MWRDDRTGISVMRGKRSPSTRPTASQGGGTVAPTSPFHLSALGRFRLTGPRGDVDLSARKLCALLTFLACSPRPQPRERLTALLWGSHGEMQARQNLRQALYRIRQAMEQDVFVADEEW